MHCLKCGRETAEDQVFCQTCLDIMAGYPVRPGAPVVLPRRQEAPPPKKQPRRRPLPPEVQKRNQHRRVRVLSVVSAIAVFLAVLFAIPAWRYVEENRPRPGQNYTVVPSGEASRKPFTDTVD